MSLISSVLAVIKWNDGSRWNRHLYEFMLVSQNLFSGHFYDNVIKCMFCIANTGAGVRFGLRFSFGTNTAPDLTSYNIIP